MTNPTAKNYDLKTMSKVITSTVASLGLGAVPTAMKRYVTFISMNNTTLQQNVLYICSAASSATTTTPTLASAAAKYSRQLEVTETDQLPRGSPDPEHPLFSIAAGAYMNALTSKGTCRLFMQYYDQ